ncbi:protein tyrosine phosphatase family protein [Sulfitobacter aestuariivivens]|uniref:Protein tyrosine phosphatase family protein n=1 Tax=Sulfitobacter aestuariivivens TaxID=2766981 RepID=A0A927D5E3_9RHOB|nr:protein tyrosine phosphatase family protein [Sulfitobacter aestuariivivens]MBD3665284.1 protein tyrosine phosphatase family protein [Sulfitobacter aestuariivivens]
MTERPDILNWRRWNDQITLSGQPTESQLAALQEDGVRVVINLGPHTNKGALENEAGTLDALGVKYVYIPVDFEAPTQANYDSFCAALACEGDALLHVHCIYNARVSAFMYRFAKDGRGGQMDAAFDLMDGIWRPGGVWADFIGKPEDADLPNRFLGYEY